MNRRCRRMDKALSVLLVIALFMVGATGVSAESATAEESSFIFAHQGVAVSDLPFNGFSFGGGVTVQIDNLKKLYAPGDPIGYTIRWPNSMGNHAVTIRLIDPYDKAPVPVTHGGAQKQTVQYRCGSSAGSVSDSLSIAQNGVFTFAVELSGKTYNQKGAVDIGVVPGNQKSTDDFLFGMHTTLNRLYTYAPDPNDDHQPREREFGVVGMPRSSDEYGRFGFHLLLDYIDYSGVNLIRDGAGFDFYQENGESKYAQMSELGMKAIFTAIGKRNLQLDWPLLGTPDYAVDRSYTGSSQSTWRAPPSSDHLKTFMTTFKDMAADAGVYNNIIFEIWNEPNSQSFFTVGTNAADRNMNAYLATLEGAARALEPTKKLSATDTRITNGGMVCWPDGPQHINNNPAYYEKYKEMAGADRLSYISIHPHGTLDDLQSFYHNYLAKNVTGIENEHLFLNESGNNNANSYVQAMHTAGKAIWAKANNCAGYVAFQLGAVSNDNHGAKDRAGVYQVDQSEIGYYMITEDLEPKPVFLAYMTAIKMLDGYTIDQTISEGNGNYAYLFKKGNSYVEVNIGSQRQAYDPARSYTQYDMLGNVDGKVKEITYRVYRECVPGAFSTPPLPLRAMESILCAP